jgi:hypothetical protein
MVMARLSVLLILTVGLASCRQTSPSLPSDVCPSLPKGISVFVNAGQTLRVNFTVPATTGTDVLQTEIAYAADPLAATPVLTCRLLNGDVLLASGPCSAWQSSSAAYPLDRVPVIDFSSIARGTDPGRIEFAVASGSILFELSGTISVSRTVASTPSNNVTYVASGTITSFTLLSDSCR